MPQMQGASEERSEAYKGTASEPRSGNAAGEDILEVL